MADLSLLAACQDRALLGGAKRWWPKQLELLASLDGPERYHHWDIGRQSGKDTMIGAATLHNAVMRADLDAVVRGGPRHILVVAPSQEQSVNFIRTCQFHLDNSRLLRRHARVLSDRIEFSIPREDAGGRYTSKTSIVALPASSSTVRGYTASLLVFNEQAHLAATGGPGSDTALWDALTPSLRVFGADGRIVCISTPNGLSGKFYELHQAIEAGTLPSSRGWQLATWEVDPNVTDEQIDMWRAELGPALFEQEYGAQHVESGGAFFNLGSASFLDDPALPDEGHRWVCGIDPAVSRDRFGLVIVGESREDLGTLLCGPVESFEMASAGLLSIDREASAFKRTLEAAWGVMEPFVPHGLRIATDTYKVNAVRSFFGRRGIWPTAVNLKGREQMMAYVACKTRLEDWSLRLWRSPALLEDLRTVQMRDAETIHLPRVHGHHCDTASALVAACSMLRGVNGFPSGEAKIGLGNLDENRWSAELDGRPRTPTRPDPDGWDKRSATALPPGPVRWGGSRSIRDMEF